MKSTTLMCISAITLLAALAIPAQLAAQHTRYRLIDLGTLGGLHSCGSVNGDGFSLLNNAGIDFTNNPHADSQLVQTPVLASLSHQLNVFVWVDRPI
jgi:hypothetical protein